MDKIDIRLYKESGKVKINFEEATGSVNFLQQRHKMKKLLMFLAITAGLLFLISCGGQANLTITSPTTYQLTHSSEDAEYILNWDLIISQCSEIGEFDRQ